MNNTSFDSNKSEPFHKLMGGEVRQFYADKLLDAPLYVLLIAKTQRKAGWKWTFQVKDFCKEWGIAKTTFYRAVSKLRDLGLLHWEVKDAITIWHGTDIAKESSPTNGTTDFLPSEDSPTDGTPVPPVEQLDPPVEQQTAESLTNTSAAETPDISQINFNSSSDQSEEENKVKEEGDGNQRKINLGEKSTLHPLAALENQAGPVAKTEYLDRGKSSAAPPPKSKNQIFPPEDEDILRWLMQSKIPTLNLDEPPRNPEKYARGMLRNDGDALRREFAGILGDRVHQSNCVNLTKLVQDRAIAWRNVGANVVVFNKLDGLPAVMLDGTEITGTDFLNKPVDQTPLVTIATFSGVENIKNRSYRQGRLKTASNVGESPGLDFLADCWGDILLRSQVKTLIAKYPSWGIEIASNPEFGLIQTIKDVCD